MWWCQPACSFVAITDERLRRLVCQPPANEAPYHATDRVPADSQDHCDRPERNHDPRRKAWRALSPPQLSPQALIRLMTSFVPHTA